MSAQDRIIRLRLAAKQFAKNRLTLGFAAMTAAYWVVAAFVLPEWRDAAILFMRAAVTLGLIITAGTYFEAATRSLARGEDGSVAQWLTGVVIFCLSMAGSSVYTMAWIYADRPVWMTNHPLLGFILMWQVVGVALLIKAPDADNPGSFYKSRWLIALAFVAAVVAAFAAGRVTKQAVGSPSYIPSTYPACSPERPVWGNVNSKGVKIYHDEESPYRAMVHPDTCFATIGEAQDAGFKPPG